MAGIRVDRMSGGRITNNVVIGADTAVSIGAMQDGQISGNIHIKDVNGPDLAELVLAIKSLRDPEADALLEQLPNQLRDENFWKKMIDLVGKPAGKIALAILIGVAHLEIQEYLASKGITIP